MKTIDTPNKSKNILVRIKDFRLYEELKSIAKLESRSINGQIIFFLKKSVNDGGVE